MIQSDRIYYLEKYFIFFIFLYFMCFYMLPLYATLICEFSVWLLFN